MNLDVGNSSKLWKHNKSWKNGWQWVDKWKDSQGIKNGGKSEMASEGVIQKDGTVKVKMQLRIGKTDTGKYVFAVSSKENKSPIRKSGYNDGHYPTIFTEVELTIDPAMFDPAKLVMEVKKQAVGIAVDIPENI